MMRRYSNAVLLIGAEIDATIAAVWEIISPIAGPAGSGLLLEDGASFLLAEDGSFLILES